jgi:glycosyltransferase involved in cell wall biosynthesis
MHYGVPALLQRAGMLQHFYTDAVGNVGVLRLLDRVLPRNARPAPIRRLLGRRLPDEISPAKVTSAPVRSIVEAAARTFAHGWSPVSTVDWLRQRMLADGFRGATGLYSLDNSDLDLIKEAKRRGMLVVYEQIIGADVGRILRDERSRYPGLEGQDSEEFVEEGIRRDIEVWNLADVSLAPSEFVRNGMIALGGPADRIALVPYGLPETWTATEASQPVPGRVLFVGTVCLRKGNHYLAEAYRILRARGVACQFRVVGPYDPAIIQTELFRGPDYVGQVPRDAVAGEFARADVFALPTVAEGLALVHLEALALGVPVITTPNCGPVVRDGVDGYVVPIRDPAALADRIQTVLVDRALRDRMAKNARERAASFAWPNYRARLLAAIEAAADTRRHLTDRPVKQ